MRTLTLTLVILGAASATGGEYRWLNVNHYPEDLIASPYLWSAIRIEDPQFTSYRIAADDFELTATTRIQRITFWSVEIGLPKIFGGDWYVYADAGGMPGALVAHAAGVPLAHELTGYSHVEGPIWSNVMNTPDLMLPPGRYFLAYRTYQGYVAGGKNNNTAFSTVWRRGASRAWWNFGVLTDGTVTQPWQLLQEFNTVVDNEWSFLIEGQTQSP